MYDLSGMFKSSTYILYCLFIVVNLLIICIHSTGCYYGFVNVEAYTSGLLAVVNVESCLIELKC